MIEYDLWNGGPPLLNECRGNTAEPSLVELPHWFYLD